MMATPTAPPMQTIKKPFSLNKVVYICLGILNIEGCIEMYQDEQQALTHLSNFSHELLRIEITPTAIKPVMLVPREIDVLGMLKREVV